MWCSLEEVMNVVFSRVSAYIMIDPQSIVFPALLLAGEETSLVHYQGGNMRGDVIIQQKG